MHPSEYFIRFTLAQAWGNDDQDTSMVILNRTLEAFGLLYMTELDYDRIKATFTPPEGFRFNNYTHKSTKQFMEAEKIHTLWRPSKEDKRVIVELVDGHRQVKHDLHLLLMGFLPHGVIAQKLNSKYRLQPNITDRMVSTYHHYFWNVPNASFEIWDNLLAGNKYQDAFMAALHCGEQQALYRAGFSPRVDGNRAMKEAYRQAYFRLEALRFMPDTKQTTDSYAKLAARLMNIHEILYSQGTGLQDQLKQFRQIMMKHNDPDVKAVDRIIDKMEGGSYSGDGEDAETPEQKEGDLQ